MVDLNSKFAAGGEVLRLGQVALEAVVLHGVHVVLHPDEPPLVLGVLVLVAGPDLLEVGHDVVPALHHHLQAVAARLDDAADLSH